jgi:serine/threonine-protein kinase
MGVVYRAEDLALRRPVAIKLLLSELLERPNARTRFQQEIETAANLEHPHIVPVYNGGYEDGHFFIAMRYVEGPDLGRIVERDGALSENRTLRLVGQIASALHSVHTKGIVHRDVKPQNILVWNAGEPDEHAFLTDFGIAKALDDPRRLTTAGVLGTPGYMAPELLAGMPPTPACDQYSLGCVAFELLTGHLPGSDEVAEPGSGHEPHRRSELPEQISPRLRHTIERALEVDPKHRFADLRALALQDEAASEAFERSEAISDTVSTSRSQPELVENLYTAHGLSDAEIAEIADIEKSRVVLLRRQAARRSLIGE